MIRERRRSARADCARRDVACRLCITERRRRRCRDGEGAVECCVDTGDRDRVGDFDCVPCRRRESRDVARQCLVRDARRATLVDDLPVIRATRPDIRVWEVVVYESLLLSIRHRGEIAGHPVESTLLRQVKSAETLVGPGSPGEDICGVRDVLVKVVVDRVVVDVGRVHRCGDPNSHGAVRCAGAHCHRGERCIRVGLRTRETDLRLVASEVIATTGCETGRRRQRKRCTRWWIDETDGYEQGGITGEPREHKVTGVLAGRTQRESWCGWRSYGSSACRCGKNSDEYGGNH